MPVAIRIAGSLDANILRKAIEAVVQRHESLRTHFNEVDGIAIQIVEPKSRIDFLSVDGSAPFDSDEMTQLIREFMLAPFDLGNGPLIRARIWRLSNSDHVLAIPMHHIVSDGWSLGVLLREIGLFYEAFASSKTPQLADLPIQYADYAVWQHAWLETPAAEKQRAYWAARNWNDTALDAIGNVRNQNDTVIGATHTFQIPTSLTARATAFAQSERVTPFMLLLSVFNTLLHRYTGCDAINIGTPAAGRERAETQNLVGFFINTVVIRTEFDGDPTFQEFLRHIREASLEAFDHQQYPFEKVVEAVQPDRQLSGSPLFRVMFALQNAPVPSLEFAGLQLSPISVESGTSKFELFLEIEAVGDGLRASFSYDTSRFDAEFIAGMSEHFIRLLDDGLARPNAPLTKLDFLDRSERERLTRDWQGATVPYSETTLDGLLSAQALRTPERVAVSYLDTSLTYAELDARANGLAHELAGMGVGPETLVGVYMDRSIELVVALYAILKAGGAYVPLDPGYPEARLAYMLDDADAPVVLTQAHLRDSVPENYAGRVVCVDEYAKETSSPPSIDANDSRLAYVIYTSGSTGQPKGVMNEHGGVVNRILWMQDAFQIGESDTVLQKTPFSFDVSVWEFFWPLSVGTKLVMAEPEGHKDPAYLAETIARENITTIHFVPSMLQAFLDAADTTRCTTLRRVICSGETLSVPLHDQFFAQMRCELHNLYGPTEAAVDVTYWACAPTPDLWDVPIGRPIANTQTYVLDDHLQPSPIGVPGELYLGGVQVARGYWGQAELTAERFIPDPFSDTPGARLYKTGDRCRWRTDGAIEFLGRLDAQVKIRGFRIEPGEIESNLRDHAAVHHAVVVTKTLGGEAQLVAYLVADHEIPAADLRAHICETLPDHMAPQAYVYLDALPLTPSGKLDRNALPEPQTPESAESYAPPRNDAEITLVQLWQQLLQTEPIGINDNFFELGGHSLKAVQLVNRIGSAFEMTLPVRAVFESPTIAGLAERIARASVVERHESRHIPCVDRDETVQMSFAQQRLWFLDQLDAQRAAYNIPAVVRIDGELNVEAMRRAIMLMVDRHETLRTVFEEQYGRPIPQVKPTVDIPFEYFDLQSLDSSERDTRVLDLIAQETREPFDLRDGPLIRAKVIHVAPNEYRLLLTVHHIAADGWSLGVIVRELGAIYAAECGNAPADLPALQIQYRDYAAWQNERLSGGDMETQVDYWKAQLDDASVLVLPTDHPRPPVTTHSGATHHFQITGALNAEINRMSTALDATPFMVFLSAFNTLLSRMSGQTDITVGSPVAGRNHESLENLIGLFVNTLVLRTDCSRNPDFREFVQRVRSTAMSAFDNQEVPFERLVEILQPDRQLNQNPLFQVMFVLQNAPMPPLELPGLKMAPVHTEGDTAKFDITLVLRESGDGLEGLLEYNTDLFDSGTIAAFSDRYLRILDAAVAQPDIRLSELPILSKAEQDLVLRKWNETSASFPDDTTIHSLFERQAELRPGETAVTMAGESLTYGELDGLANNVAHRLRDAGISHEELVGVCVDRGMETVIIVLGVWKAGAAFIPLDPEYPEDRIAFMVRDSCMTNVVTTPNHQERMESLGTSTLLVSELVDAYDIDTASPILQTNAHSLAYAIYTSGSTGKPKAALIEHRGVCNLAHALGEAFEIGHGTRCLQFAPFSFDAWIFEVVSALINGGTLCIAGRDERIGEPMAALLGREQINLATLPPSALMVLPEREYPDLNVIITAGEACPASLVHTWAPGRTFVNAYGPTETTVCATFQICDEDDDADPPIGPPIPNFQTYVLDPNGTPVSPGTPGELYVGGVGVARGYLNRRELTAERFLPDPYSKEDEASMYRTGDLVRHRADGNLIFLGRTDHQVKVRGFRIELGDIESALREHEKVDDAVCIVERTGTADARIIAYVQIGQATTTTSELRSHVADRLPAYMVPNIFQTLETFPLTPNGKVDRKALPRPDDSVESESHVAPRTETERSISDVWKAVLDADNIGIHDNFFERGGHSLLAVNLVSQLHDKGVTLSLQQVFENPTVAEMAIASDLSPENSAKPDGEIVVPIQPNGDALPLFAFPPAGGVVFPYYHLAFLLGTDRPFLGVQEPALQFGIKPLASIEAYAKHYVEHIRRVQPAGPYHLLGWSLGGSIAYEMARQLEAVGETVAFLGLIDTRIHDEPERGSMAVWLSNLYEKIMVGANIILSVPSQVLNGLYVLSSNTIRGFRPNRSPLVEKLKRRLAAFGLRFLLRRSEFGRVLPKEYGQIEAALPNVVSILGILKAHTKIDLQYKPGAYGGTVTLYRASEIIRGEHEHPSATFGWDALSRDVNVCMVPGNHANMMSEPHIRGLAESIKQSLAEGDALSARERK